MGSFSRKFHKRLFYSKGDASKLKSPKVFGFRSVVSIAFAAMDISSHSTVSCLVIDRVELQKNFKIRLVYSPGLRVTILRVTILTSFSGFRNLVAIKVGEQPVGWFAKAVNQLVSC
jgi:hypothetical protein